MIEECPSVPTPSGLMQTFVCHPERPGPYPVVLFLMDAPGIREELRDMARRIATVGYCVLLPNLYYRLGVLDLGPSPRNIDDPRIPRLISLMNSLSVESVMTDVEALLEFIDSYPPARRTSMACIGYCMSGRFAVNAGARWPQRIAAVASIHGTSLVTDAPESPHRVGRTVRGHLYFACAEHDEEAPLEEIEALQSSLRDSGANYEVEIYRGAHHGFVFSQRDAYLKPSAERHWERLFELFATLRQRADR
jgi:carboxymethylenebutenolidase